MDVSSKHIQWKPFLFFHAAAACLLASWLFQPTRELWNALDAVVFRFLNSSLEGSPFWQIFWAIANVRITDLFGAIFMSSFFILYIMDGKKGSGERTERLAQFLYVCAWGELGILFTKEPLNDFLKMIHFARESPSLLFPHTIMLSDAVPWLKVKDFARGCFPGDHAEILLQWTAFVWFFCDKRYAIYATVWTTFFMMPRLVAGAHWASDAFVGSLSIVCVIMAWACYSPLYGYGMELLTKFINLFRRHEHVQ